MTPATFLATYKNQALLYNQKDPSLIGQCVQAVCIYAQSNNWPIVWADAVLWWDAVGYQQVAINDLRPGNLVVWSGKVPGTNGAGHIAIFYYWLTPGKTFVSIDQNWGGKYVHTVTHDMQYVLGGLTKQVVGGKGADAPQGDEMIPNRDMLNSLFRAYLGGRDANDTEAATYIGHTSYGTMIAILEQNNPEHQDALETQRVGKLARKDDWPGQIYGLIDRVQLANTQLQQALSNEALGKQQRADLQAQLDANNQALAACTTNNQQAVENNSMLKRLLTFFKLS